MGSFPGSSISLESSIQGKVRPTHGSRAAARITKDLGGQSKHAIAPETLDIRWGEIWNF